MRFPACIVCATTLAIAPTAMAQSYMFDCHPDAWLEAGVATAMSPEEIAGWPFRLAIFLDGASGNGCEINENATGCADSPIWHGSKSEGMSTVTLARYRTKAGEPDGLLISPASGTFKGTFDGRAVSGRCHVLDFDTPGKPE